MPANRRKDSAQLWLLEAGSSLQFPADLAADYTGATLLSPVHDDELTAGLHRNPPRELQGRATPPAPR